MEKIKVLAVADRDETRYELKNRLHSGEIAFVGFARSAAALEKILSLMPNVVIIVREPDGGEYLELAEKLYVSMPGCSVILLCENVGIGAMEEAMRAGIRKVLPLDCTADQLIGSIKEGFQLEKARGKNYSSEMINAHSRLIVLFGAKGGIGKTTIAANLAVSLAHAGKKVILVDLDLQFGDANLFFDIDPRDTIAELVQGNQSFDIDTVRSFLKLHSSGVSILCAPKSPEYADIVRGEHVEKIINTIRPFFDYILVDTPPVFNETTIAAIENSDVILQVITLEISTLRNTRISMDILESLSQKEKISLIANRSAPGIVSIKDAQNILDTPIRYKISNDWKTATTAHNKGIPLIIDSPRTAIGRELRELGRLIISSTEEKP